MELYEQNVMNLSFLKTSDYDEIKSFKEIVEVLHNETTRISITKLRFSKDQVRLIKDLNEILKEYEAHTNKTDS